MRGWPTASGACEGRGQSGGASLTPSPLRDEKHVQKETTSLGCGSGCRWHGLEGQAQAISVGPCGEGKCVVWEGGPSPGLAQPSPARRASPEGTGTVGAGRLVGSPVLLFSGSRASRQACIVFLDVHRRPAPAAGRALFMAGRRSVGGDLAAPLFCLAPGCLPAH